MSKRKHGNVRKITPEEKERRRKLAEKRKERQKLEKRKLTAELITVIFIGIIFLGIIILSAIFRPEILLIFFIVISVIAIIIFDQSGLRGLIFMKYPDNFIFSDFLKSQDPERSVPMQIAGTLNWITFILLIIGVKYEYIWALIWLLSIGVGLYYMLTTDSYSLEKGAKYECSAMFLLVTPSFLLMALISNVRIKPYFIAFVIIFVVIYNIIYAVRVNQGNQKYSRIIYGIIVTVFCASSGLLAVNKYIDFSEPKSLILEIKDKESYTGKNSTYYIYVQDWSNPAELIDIKVSSDTYHSLETGDRAVIEVYSGSLSMEYYEYKEKAPD